MGITICRSFEIEAYPISKLTSHDQKLKSLKAEIYIRECHFMAKKITDKDGNVYVQKKAWYKRWWVWVIIVLVLLLGIGSMGSDNDSSSSSDTTTESSTKSSSSSTHASAQQTAALHSAETYANDMNMSKAAILDQLTSDAGDKFDQADAQYAVDHVKTDWNKNALKSAESYQKDQDMSTEEIRDQLTSPDGDQFTQEQADYAINHLSK